MALTLSQRKRLAIIDAAIGEFQKNGYQATSMDVIAAAASVSKRTVYNHFASKEALFAELVRQMMHMGHQATQIEFQADLLLSLQLTQIARQEIALLQDERFMQLSRITMAEAMSSPEQVKKVLAEIGQQESAFERWVQAAIAAKKMSTVDPAYATRQFMGLIKAQAFWPQMLTAVPIPNQVQADQIVHDAVSMFVNRYAL